MARRYTITVRIPKGAKRGKGRAKRSHKYSFYAIRDRRGRFKRVTKIPRSIRADMRKKVRQKTKRRGYGHRQDYR